MEFINKNPKIFILSGKARAGKDTTASYIYKYYEKKGKKIINLQFSSYIKDYAKKISGWDGSDETKPRQLLIDLGTNLIREKIDKYLFVNRIVEDIKIMSYFFDIITISDARLIEELEIPKSTFENVYLINIVRANYENGLTIEQKKSLTEVGLDGYSKYDYIINNDSTLNELEEKIYDVLEVI